LSRTTVLPFKAVLFDLDGTLVEFKFKVRESRLAMIELLAKKGFDRSHWTENTRTQQMIDEAEKQWKDSEIVMRNQPDFEVIRQELFKLLDRFEYEALLSARPLGGSVRILKKIKEAQLFSGVVTNSGRGPVETVLSEYGLLPYLSVVITRDDMQKLKPNPNGLIEAVKRLGIRPDESLYVGDSVIDIEAARLASMKCASVSTGLYKADVLRESSPDYLLNSIEELEKLVLRSA
jgi:HAD superfamily hydrolase (TIGR01509 family)